MQFCEIIDRACDGIRPNDYLTMYDEFVSNLASLEDKYPYALKTYLSPTHKKMRLWVKALQLRKI